MRSLLERVERQAEDLAAASDTDSEQPSVEVHMAVLEAAGTRRISALTHQLREPVSVASTL